MAYFRFFFISLTSFIVLFSTLRVIGIYEVWVDWLLLMVCSFLPLIFISKFNNRFWLGLLVVTSFCAMFVSSFWIMAVVFKDSL